MFWAKVSKYQPILFFVGLLFIMLGLVDRVSAHSNDPLSKEEISRIQSLIGVNSRVARSAVRKKSNSSDKPRNEVPRNEVLLIERHLQKNAPKGQRLADVFTYDYHSNELIESLVDLNTSKVLQTTRKQGVQLPLTQNELRRVKQIIFEDDVERQILENEYRRITSQKLINSSDLYFKAFTFIANNLPHRANEASKLCGIQRCAQIVLYTGQNIVFEVSPIVNISKGVVTQRVGF